LNKGVRRYGTVDVHPRDHCRNNWEVMVVHAGAIRPMLDKSVAPGPFRSETLWLMPPESRHCWVGPSDRPAEVFVFHFASIHPLLQNSLPASRMFTLKLSPEHIAEIQRIYTDVESHFLSPKVSSGIAFEVAMLRVSELILRNDRQLSSISGFDPNAERVLQALQWYRENLSRGVKATDVAKALNVSPGHLRRLFLRVNGESPNAVFAQLKVEEACRLMSSTHLSFKEVAGLCGFRGFSEFYRFFRKQIGTSPSVWRSNEFYKQSNAPAAAAPPGGQKRRTR
jgi:AraC-like DNA-binding protein